jgi:uracil-DNA glycosylase family 4
LSDIAVSEIGCDKCALYETSITNAVQRSGIYGRGTGKLGLWLYGDTLTAKECEIGLPFTGQAGSILSKILSDINLHEDDLYFTNTLRCYIPNKRTPKAHEIKTCMDFHAKLDVPITPPKLVVCLGNVPLKAVLNKQKIKDNRGVIFDCELFNCKAMASYHPASILYDKKGVKYKTLKSDLLKAKEFILETQEKSQVHHRILINSKNAYLEWMGILANPLVERMGDIETTSLDFWSGQIISISFTTEIDGEIYSVAFLTVPKEGWWCADLDEPEIHQALQKVLALPTDFHGGLFDVKWFWKRKFSVKFGMDTMDLHLMIDESAPHNLQYCSSIYNQSNEGYKQEIAGLLGEDGHHHDLSPQVLLDYNNTDTYESYQLKKKFVPLMRKEETEEFFHRLAMPLKRSLTRMSYRGFMMNRQGIIDKSNEYRGKIQEKREELWDLAGGRFDYGGNSKDIKRVLYKDLNLPIVKRSVKTKMPSSDKFAMKELARVSPVPALILELRAYEYALNMYLDGNSSPYKMKNGQVEYQEPSPGNGMLCRLDERDRIHGPFLSGGTISGRPSCPKPNLLNIPKNPVIRNLFIAPPGWKLIEVDYSQAELVLLAYLSGDEQFIADIGSADFHQATAKSLMKAEIVDPNVRVAAKAINFLKSYGGGAEKLGNTLRLLEEERYFNEFKENTKYDKVCLNQKSWYHNKSSDSVPIKYKSVNRERNLCYVCEADDWLKKWDKTYAKVPLYKQQMMNLWKSQGYILGLYGRKKRFPPIFDKQQESYCDRISVNYMCQNGVSETVNRSLVDIDFMLDAIFGWHPQMLYNVPGIVLGVYDSIICEAPDDLVPDVKELMVELMSIPVPQIGVSLKCDIKIGQRWGEDLAPVKDITEIEEVEEIN